MTQNRQQTRWQVGALFAAALLVSGCTGGRVGLVDSRRILTESAKALRYQKEVDDRERAMLQDLQLLVNQLTREDLEARRQQYFRELQELRADRQETLNRDIRETIQQIVRRKRLRGVIVMGPIVYTREGTTVDITQEIIDRLK